MSLRTAFARAAARLRTAFAGLAAAVGASLALGLLCADTASAQACSNEAARLQQGSTYLPECRAFELASPVLKNEEEVLVPEVRGPTQVPFEAARGGGSVAFMTIGAFPESSSGGFYDQYLAQSASPGSSWRSLSLQPEGQFLESYTREGSTGETEYYSPDLSCGIEQTELPLPEHSGETKLQLPEGETAAERITNLYVWHAGAAAGGAPTIESTKLISSAKPANAGEAELTNTYSVDGATAGCGRVIFESEYQLLGAPPGSIYEWVEGAGKEGKGLLRVASVLGERENAQHEPEPVLARAVSGAGAGEHQSDVNELTSEPAGGGQEISRVVFTAAAEQGADHGNDEIFLRQTRTGTAPARSEAASTIEVSASQGSTPVDTGARFQAASDPAASTRGQEILFTANYGLTHETSTGSEAPASCDQSPGQTGPGCDLYAYNVSSGSLTDLSVDDENQTGDKKGAGVVSVLGIAEEGLPVLETTERAEPAVYFSATGELVPGQGGTQAQNEQSAQANVYAYQPGLGPDQSGELHFVTRIGQKEAGTGAKQGEELDTISGPSGMHYTASRVSPNGAYLLFATNLKVRESDGEEYENRDQVTGEPDYEYYEYSLSAQTVTCASCNPDRAVRPIQRALHSSFGTAQTNEDGYLQRNLSDDGAVFFDSVDPLVERAQNDTVNVYEWQPGEVEGCQPVLGKPDVGSVCLLDSGTDPNASYFADASASGEDVYITTQQQLAPQDQDGLRDLYDVRVGGGIVAETASRCAEEGCQGRYSGIGTGGYASESGIGGGNPASTTGPPSPSGKSGVAAFTAHSVSVKRTVRGTSVVVSVSAPAAGRIAISGAGLRTASKSVSKPGLYKLDVVLTTREKKLLERRRHVSVTLRVVFAPSSGSASAIDASVTFR